MDHATEISKRYARLLAATKQIYIDGAELCIRSCPDRLGKSAADFRETMQLLHEGLVIKVYVMMASADQRWSAFEKVLASVLCEHLWGKKLEGKDLRKAASRFFTDAERLTWSQLVKPFRQLPPLHDFVGPLETAILRMGHVVAKADGEMQAPEASAMRALEEALDELILPVDDEEDDGFPATGKQRSGSASAQEQQQDQEQSGSSSRSDSLTLDGEDAGGTESKPDLGEALAELDDLIGLEKVKAEVRTLINVLEMRRRREELGLPTADLSLHMVFRGNPGTGKTTVARLVAKIFAAMGILEKGHLVETDRSGLVAEYAGQTGPKTHRVVDQALDGVLFIDEAYSLVSSEGEDPYGSEALQALLKRMEDQRERLVVILAGYPKPLDELLESNPGLRSRFTQHFTFDDHDPAELGSVFELLAERLHYTFGPETRARLLQAFTWAYERRDEHFGNGRYARNVLESAIRRLANRIAATPELTVELLTAFEPEDFEFGEIPSHWFRSPNELNVFVTCPHCENGGKIRGDYLGRDVVCPKCKQKFAPKWGKVEE